MTISNVAVSVVCVHNIYHMVSHLFNMYTTIIKLELFECGKRNKTKQKNNVPASFEVQIIVSLKLSSSFKRQHSKIP